MRGREYTFSSDGRSGNKVKVFNRKDGVASTEYLNDGTPIECIRYSDGSRIETLFYKNTLRPREKRFYDEHGILIEKKHLE